MDLIIANKYGSVYDAKSLEAIPNVPGNTFLKPMYLNLKKEELTEPYQQHVWTYSCINAKATALKSVPFAIVRYDRSNKAAAKSILNRIRSAKVERLYKFGVDFIKREGFEVVEDGAVYNLFNFVNPFMCRAQLFESYMINMHMTGEVFWELLNDKGEYVDINELPTEMYVTSREGFEAIFDDSKTKLVGWKKRVNNKDVILDLHQVIRFYRYNPYGFRGLAPFDVVKHAASQDLKAQVFNEAIFDNGGIPGGFIKVKEFLSADQRKTLIDGFETRHKGPQNSGKVGLLQNESDYLFNPNTQQDMQYQEGRKWNRDETHAGLGVPKIKNSIYEDLQLATALQADKSFWMDQIIPEGRYIEDVVNSRLFDGRIKETQGLYCLFDFSNVEALQTNATVMSEVAKTYFSIGWSRNEINERLNLGFDESDYGDVGYLPMSLVPIDQIGIEPDPTTPDEEKTIIRHVETKSARKEKLSRLWIARVFTPIEQQFQAKVKKYWFDLRKEQLRLFEEATKSIKAIPTYDELESILFNSKEWQDKLKKVATPHLQQAAKYSLEDAADLLGIEVWDSDDPRVLRVLDNKINKIVGITDRCWKGVKATLATGIKEGETVELLADRIRSTFNNLASPARTLTIARTETAQIASPVRHVVLTGEGVKRVEWSTAADEAVREDHDVLDGVGPVKIGHNYMDDLGRSGTLIHPSDPQGPADQVINCRCVELPAD